VGSQPTIYDVAQAAGVAASTVSRAFARPGRVNPETATRIFAAARELGYRTGSVPRLAAAPSRTIALVVTDITNPFYAEIIRGVHEAAADLGYTVVLSHTMEDPHIERAWIEEQLPGTAGVVLASSRMSDNAIRTLAQQKPVVVLNRRLPEVPSLLIDNARGMRRALEHLGELGHRSVTYVSGPEASWTDGMRWQALREAGHELHIAVRRVGPVSTPTIDAGFRMAQAAMAPPATAIIAYNDVLAIGLIKGLRSLGHVVPDDVSVIGVDNILLGEVVDPELTTVASPLRSQGESAVRAVVAMAGGATPTRKPLLLPVRLVVRGSTAQRRRKRTSPASGTTRVPSSASAAARSRESGSR
jgi:LacI family transcriptional regulator